ncbi:MAG: glycerol-3-phosphate 1-O-acyltransferase PlsY [Rectinema sp.]|jgi:glycerol-3-phosphate acyltransferase PlsY|uniref:Glycerol-3-phosphate acyltransferase n=1 Tax=uncultured spirochete TaxID=156406 RepID=A0A3P3XN37_9SPIR|nr:Glycerol-3-phosphate acyltransferase [uncultured spirochete]
MGAFFGVLLAYLAGSFPTGLIVGKLLFGKDPRERGSKATGATNIFRVFGAKAAIPVVLFDVGKGALAVFLASWMGRNAGLPREALQVMGAVAAMAGHVFPVFAGFRGGKGVATGAGALIVMVPTAAIFCALGFLLVLGLTGIVSAASMTAAIVLPLAIALGAQGRPANPWYLGFGVAVALFIVFTHRANIKRILSGQEQAFEKFRFLRRKKKSGNA